MTEHESNRPVPELIIPENIGELLDTELEPTGYPGANTEKYGLRGYPELLVRLNPGHDHLEQEASKRARDELAGYGVDVLPSQVVDRYGQAYVITKRIDGLNLCEALKQDSNPALIEAADRTWAGIADYLLEGRQHNRAMAEDIQSPYQYMYGVMAGDTAERLWLADLSEHTNKVNRDAHYVEEVLEAANGIVEIENLSGERLATARKAIERTLEVLPDNTVAGHIMRLGIGSVLQHNVTIHPWDLEPVERGDNDSEPG